MANNVAKSISRSLHKVAFQIQKHSPEILMCAGIVGGVASAVMACKATTKVNGILAKAKDQVQGIHQVREVPELQQMYVEEYGEEYTEEQSKKDLAITYAQTGIEFAKLYGPSVVLGAVSIGCILASGNIMRKRNAALTAAYAVVDKGFKQYRERLIDRFGNELDRELRYNIKTEQVEETVVDEDGKEKTVTTTIQKAEPQDIPTTSKIYCEGCKGWDKNPEYNRIFLTQVQAWANDRLQARGHLFLNEVYDALGINITEEGNSLGWVYDESNPELHNYVDFGFADIDNERKRAFVNGDERNVWLDFNYDGNVWALRK